jgi:hypothetical protein
MTSKIASAIGLKTHPVALLWADHPPAHAIRFTPGRWGCVMSVFAAVAAKGRCGAFDRNSYGCWGGGVGLGFGNCYETFPGGVDAFCRFLADGNDTCAQGRKWGERVASWGRPDFADDFSQGERYLKDAATTARFLQAIPMRDIPAPYVVLKTLAETDLSHDDVKNITFFVNPDQLSALVVLANYAAPGADNVIIPWAAACQVIGIFGYREIEAERPRAIIGMTDLSARVTVRKLLGRDAMSFTVAPRVLEAMEQNVDGSFLQRNTWRELQES